MDKNDSNILDQLHIIPLSIGSILWLVMTYTFLKFLVTMGAPTGFLFTFPIYLTVLTFYIWMLYNF